MIWTVLYPVIVFSFGFVFVMALQGNLPWIVALPFAVNLVASAPMRNGPWFPDKALPIHLQLARRSGTIEFGEGSDSSWFTMKHL